MLDMTLSRALGVVGMRNLEHARSQVARRLHVLSGGSNGRFQFVHRLRSNIEMRIVSAGRRSVTVAPFDGAAERCLLSLIIAY